MPWIVDNVIVGNEPGALEGLCSQRDSRPADTEHHCQEFVSHPKFVVARPVRAVSNQRAQRCSNICSRLQAADCATALNVGCAYRSSIARIGASACISCWNKRVFYYRMNFNELGPGQP